jgi:phosphatidylinositol alpha-1,6-mannosyltransferase
MSASPLDIIGLFPGSEPNAVGGVQASGRDAWNGILGRLGDQRAHAFSYRPGTSKAKAVLQAIGNRRKAHVALVWHLHLLKLLPVLDPSTPRVLLFLHGIEAWRRHDPLTTFLLKHVNLILTNSDYTWSRFIRCNPRLERASHRTVHLGIGTPLPPDTPCHAEAPSVLMVGRLDAREDYKGHRQVIEAWPGVLERKPGAELWIVGDGDLRPGLEDLAARCAPRHSIRFRGQVSDAEKDDLLGRCRCLAMPSRGEGFGLVYLEAMRAGRPCIVSNGDAGREVVNAPEAGLAVDPDNSREIADAVARMLTPGREWADWSRRARERYESHFTARHFHQRLLAAVFEN